MTPARRAAADRAAGALRAGQAPDGCLGDSREMHANYAHAIAGEALAEHVRSTSNAESRAAAARAVTLTLAAQNPGAGWRYGRADGASDTSLTMRSAVFLDAARSADCADAAAVDTALAGALAWVVSMTHDNGRTGYQQRGGGPARTIEMQAAYSPDLSESLTACGVAVRLAARQPDLAKDPAYLRSLGLLAAKPPAGNATSAAVDLYYWEAGATALRRAAPRVWQRWWPRLRASIFANIERRPGCAAGSFAAADPWTADGGRTYSTAMAALCLEQGIPEPHLLTKPTAPQAKLIAAIRAATTAPGSPAQSAQADALAAIDVVFATE
jgi:hypothetical protein